MPISRISFFRLSLYGLSLYGISLYGICTSLLADSVTTVFGAQTSLNSRVTTEKSAQQQKTVTSKTAANISLSKENSASQSKIGTTIQHLKMFNKNGAIDQVGLFVQNDTQGHIYNITSEIDGQWTRNKIGDYRDSYMNENNLNADVGNSRRFRIGSNGSLVINENQSILLGVFGTVAQSKIRSNTSSQSCGYVWTASRVLSVKGIVSHTRYADSANQEALNDASALQVTRDISETAKFNVELGVANVTNKSERKINSTGQIRYSLNESLFNYLAESSRRIYFDPNKGGAYKGDRALLQIEYAKPAYASFVFSGSAYQESSIASVTADSKDVTYRGGRMDLSIIEKIKRSSNLFQSIQITESVGFEMGVVPTHYQTYKLELGLRAQ
jgi:hypothetical protein